MCETVTEQYMHMYLLWILMTLCPIQYNGIGSYYINGIIRDGKWTTFNGHLSG